MAWAWSHTDEGIDAACENLHGQSRKFLLEAYGEWHACHEDGDEEFDSSKYSAAVEEAERLGMVEESLANYIWERAESLSTCDNGGFEAWVCPYGCHTVSFGEEE